MGNAVPAHQTQSRLPFAQRKEALKAIEEIHKEEIIESSVSPWASLVVLVKKKDGSTRFCIDYCKLNDLIKKDSYPLAHLSFQSLTSKVGTDKLR